jgi:signal transduction histidine kinase
MKFHTKLIILTLLVNLTLGVGLWQLLVGVSEVQQQVRLLAPATAYLQGISGVHSGLTRQTKEVLDYLVSHNPVDRAEFITSCGSLESFFRLWRDATTQQLLLGVEGESEDKNLAEESYLLYQGWRKSMDEIFVLADEDAWDLALQRFHQLWASQLNLRLYPALARALQDGMVEVENTYHRLILAVGMVSWDREASSLQLENIHNSMNLLIGGNQINAGVNRQFSALVGYLLQADSRNLQLYGYNQTLSHEALAVWSNSLKNTQLTAGQPDSTSHQIAAMEKTYRRFLRHAESAIQLKQAGQTGRALRQISEQDDSLIADFHNITAGSMRESAAELVNRAAATRRTGIVLLALLLGMSSLFALGIFRDIFNSLKTLGNGMAWISKGDLGHRINLQRDDFIGKLAQTFNIMTDNLCQTRTALETLTTDLEDRVAKRTTQLEAANRDLQAFNAMVSHDLRSPLTIISGYSQWLLCENPTDSRQEAATCIAAAAEKMDNIVSALEFLSRADQKPLKRETLDLSQMALQIIQRFLPDAPQRQVSIKINPTPPACGDRNLLEIVLNNLLGNAWKYSAEKSSTEIEFNARNHAGQTVWFVRDQGAGFDMHKSPLLFKPYSRLHSAEEFSGTGIGLLTVQRIVQRHGGKIWAESIEGSGATFYFRLG